MAARLQVLASGLEFPEGPVAMEDGSLIVVEIRSGHVTRITPDGGKTRIAHTGGGPNGAALGPDGHIYVCNNGGFEWGADPRFGHRPTGQAHDYSGGRIERIDLSSGKVERLYEHSEFGPLRGPNDIVMDSAGGFWFTDLGKVRASEMDRSAVYYARQDGSGITARIFPMIQPNGIGLSPDEKTLYVAETLTGRLWAFDLEAPGKVRPNGSGSPHGGEMIYSDARYEVFDSLGVDAAGNICIATPIRAHSPGGITVVNPSGKAAGFIEVSEKLPTNICFGGSNGGKAFITVSGSGDVVVTDWPAMN